MVVAPTVIHLMVSPHPPTSRVHRAVATCNSISEIPTVATCNSISEIPISAWPTPINRSWPIGAKKTSTIINSNLASTIINYHQTSTIITDYPKPFVFWSPSHQSVGIQSQLPQGIQGHQFGWDDHRRGNRAAASDGCGTQLSQQQTCRGKVCWTIHLARFFGRMTWPKNPP